jgi:hypothetical protein
MFTLPLTLAEYHELVDVKYGHDAATTAGWALYDSRGRIHGWHRQQPGSRQWAQPADAFAGFVPDTRSRRHLARIGYAVTATRGVEELADLLRRARGDATDNEHQDHDESAQP